MYLKLQFLLHKKKNTVSPLQDESANAVYENNRCLFWESHERADKNNVCPECRVFLCVKVGGVGMYRDNFDLTC
jgi:hypothetical protein